MSKREQVKLNNKKEAALNFLREQGCAVIPLEDMPRREPIPYIMKEQEHGPTTAIISFYQSCTKVVLNAGSYYPDENPAINHALLKKKLFYLQRQPGIDAVEFREFPESGHIIFKAVFLAPPSLSKQDLLAFIEEKRNVIKEVLARPIFNP